MASRIKNAARKPAVNNHIQPNSQPAPAPQKQAEQRVPSEDEIRTLAYYKWLDAGMPAGDGIDFWLAAERELANWHWPTLG